jgi:hypothetical protein
MVVGVLSSPHQPINELFGCLVMGVCFVVNIATLMTLLWLLFYVKICTIMNLKIKEMLEIIDFVNFLIPKHLRCF